MARPSTSRTINQGPRTSNYLTGAALFEDGALKELVVYCIDPVPGELEEMGYLEEDYVASVEIVIDYIKGGDIVSASFRGATESYPLEIVTRAGQETLEIADVGQPEQFKTLRNLPGIPTSQEQAWVLVFYEAYKELGQGRVDYQELSDVSWGSYAEHGTKDPAAAAAEVFKRRPHTGSATKVD